MKKLGQKGKQSAEQARKEENDTEISDQHWKSEVCL